MYTQFYSNMRMSYIAQDIAIMQLINLERYRVTLFSKRHIFHWFLILDSPFNVRSFVGWTKKNHFIQVECQHLLATPSGTFGFTAMLIIYYISTNVKILLKKLRIIFIGKRKFMLSTIIFAFSYIFIINIFFN